MNEEKKLKPVVFVRGDYNKKYLQNTLQQKVLLKATQITDDPKELRRMIGVKSVAEVYRTLDRMSMREELHKSMHKKGVTWDYLVDKIKGIADSSDSDAIKLKALITFLQTFGIDKYNDAEKTGGKSWEELLADAAKNDPSVIEITQGKEYEVITPKVPEDERRRIEDERALGKDLYENRQ